MQHKAIKRCLSCDGTQLLPVLDLGNQPPANSYVKDLSVSVPSHPLGLNRCEACWHSQLTVCVDRREIFSKYHYASGTSKTLLNYFTWFAERLKEYLPENARVLDIAANDGSFVRELLKKGIDAIGVDPAENIVVEAEKEAIPVLRGFWPEVSSELEGKFDAIICMNVVAHVDSPELFVAECERKLSKNGLLFIQTSQARMFENAEFDTCYHEHLSFFNTSSMNALAKRCDLKLIGEFFTKIHGDSYVYVLSHINSDVNIDLVKDIFSAGDFALPDNVQEYEEKIELYRNETYSDFERKSLQVIQSLRDVVSMHRVQGDEIAFVGAAAKAMTIINAAGVKPDHFFDEATLKIGAYPPGMNVKISSLSSCAKLKNSTLFVITAWNFKEELLKKIQHYGVPAGSKFYVYFPKQEYFSS